MDGWMDRGKNKEIKTLGTHDNVLGTEERDYFSAAMILKEEEAHQIRTRECCESPWRSPTLCSLP